ncbi:uncharacterized protein I303_106729 [Kwoniella dejecticola CBS 10117]|uniref:DinB-like domain-containing protein n=1 Tax=Kwoniella dejecticola CBS 10117 TaxID=1296121 RepID=A0A1A5ZTV4_9TREE|nr:uncharacterized protein I303_08628 [Kwoniella dejecticola CBS 10117]OBR81243.1 hypothetical protein I303_08628 [Kwoniella dejecticola CBS 10117]
MPSSSNAHTSLNHTLVAMRPNSQDSLQIQTKEDRAEALLELSISLIESAIDVLRTNITADEQLTRQSTLMPGGTLGKHFRHVIESFRAFLLPLIPSKTSSSYSSSPSPSSPTSSLTSTATPTPTTTTPTTTTTTTTTTEINYDNIQPSSRRPIARSVKACISALEEIRDELISWGDQSRHIDLPSSSSLNQPISGTGVAGENGIAENRNTLGDVMDGTIDVVAITPTKQVMGSTIGRELWYCSLHAIHHFSMLRTIAVHEHGIELPVEFGTAPSTLLYRGLNWKPPTENKEIRVAVKSKL